MFEIRWNPNDILLCALLFYLTNVTIVKCEDSVFRIRKCCGENELILERTGRCSEFKLLRANKHIYYLNGTDEGARFLSDIDMQGLRPWWFPPQSEILSIRNNKSLERFPKDYQLTAGQGQPCKESETSFLPAYFYKYSFYDDGSILVHPQKGLLESQIRFDPLSFCIDRIELEDDVSKEENSESVLDVTEVGDYMVMLCPCTKATCILKCCELGMLFDMHDENKNSCSQNDEVDDWTPVYSKDSDAAPDYFFLHGLPECKPDESVVLPNYSDGDGPGYIIFSNGTARIQGETFVNQPMQFCGENILEGKDRKVRNHILRCYPKNGVQDQWKIVRRFLYGWASIIGAVFLFLTLFVHYLLPSLRKIHDKCIICQTWSLFFLHVFVAITNLAMFSLGQELCALIGFLIQYSSLASFFWLNVLCFDISYTFSSYRIARSSYAILTRKKQIFYYMYGWITPALIVGMTATVEYFPGLSEYLIKPEFSNNCWFKKDSVTQLLYFYGPIAILLAINFFLFIYTMVRIMRARCEISSTLRNQSHENKRFILYLKLFILMGVSWIMELISWAVGGPVYYWFLPDIINLLRAVFIFVSLCWKKQVWEELKKKIGAKDVNFRRPSNTRTSTVPTFQNGEIYKFSNNADSSL